MSEKKLQLPEYDEAKYRAPIQSIDEIFQSEEKTNGSPSKDQELTSGSYGLVLPTIKSPAAGAAGQNSAKRYGLSTNKNKEKKPLLRAGYLMIS